MNLSVESVLQHREGEILRDGATNRFQHLVSKEGEPSQSNDDTERSKWHFLAELSRDLRAPLNAIIGFSEVLSGMAGKALQTEKREEYIELIHKAALHLENTLKDRLELTNLETGKSKLVLEVFEPVDTLQDIFDVLQHMALNVGIDLHVNYSKSLSAIQADKHALKQALITLVSSIIQMSNSGDWIDIKFSKFAAKTLISINFNAPFLPDNLVNYTNAWGPDDDVAKLGNENEAIFPFLISRNLVDLHHGSMEVFQNPDTGTRISIKLPNCSVSKQQKPFDPTKDVINLNQNRQECLQSSIRIEQNKLAENRMIL